MVRLGCPTSRLTVPSRVSPFDLAWMAAAPLIALGLRDPRLLDPGDFPNELAPGYLYALVTIACALASFRLFRVGDGISRFFYVHDVLAICGAVATTVASSAAILFVFTRLEGVPRSTPLIYGLVLGGGLILSRTLARVLYNSTCVETDGNPPALRPLRLRHVVLVGVDRFAATAIKLIDLQQPRTTQIVAALDARASFNGRAVAGVKIVGDPDELDAIIDEYAVHGVEIDEVWLADGATGLPQGCVPGIHACCANRGLKFARVSEALNLASRPSQTASKPRAGGAETVVLSDYFKWKRAIDIIGASVLVVVLLPLTLLTACLVLFDVDAPVLFWQQRIGRNGREFLLYKFRTYRAPFDRSGAPIPSERRLSKLGRAIRAMRTDEIPQLLNVLAGDMSLIGPRPLLAADQPSDPRLRLSVRPGITGWAQINGGTFISSDEKDALDGWYIRHASLWLDVKIAISTVLFTLTGEKVNYAALEQASSWSARNLASAAVPFEKPAGEKATLQSASA
jgi:lipopolysaccharide/colanic/teichoic acid biosynthesis glycosyltransferase